MIYDKGCAEFLKDALTIGIVSSRAYGVKDQPPEYFKGIEAGVKLGLVHAEIDIRKRREQYIKSIHGLQTTMKDLIALRNKEKQAYEDRIKELEDLCSKLQQETIKNLE